MDRTKPDRVLRGRPIAEKVVAKMKQRMRSTVVNIRNVLEYRVTAEELQKTVATQEELAGLDLAHAVYLYTENRVSVISEQLTRRRYTLPIIADGHVRRPDRFL